MIAKQSIGKSFSGILRYALAPKKQAEIIGGTLVETTASGLDREFRASTCLRPQVQRCVYHVAIAFRPSEQLNNSEIADIADRYLERMGFDPLFTQAVYIRHHDTEHPHVHVVASRIQIDGQVISDSNNWFKGNKLCRQLEAEYGLEVVDGTQCLIRSIQKEEREMIARGIISNKLRLQEAIITVAQKEKTAEGFTRGLQSEGIEVVGRFEANGRLVGISYKLRDSVVSVRGSALGRAFSLNGLQKYLGVKYEQAREVRNEPDCAEDGSQTKRPARRFAIRNDRAKRRSAKSNSSGLGELERLTERLAALRERNEGDPSEPGTGRISNQAPGSDSKPRLGDDNPKRESLEPTRDRRDSGRSTRRIWESPGTPDQVQRWDLAEYLDLESPETTLSELGATPGANREHPSDDRGTTSERTGEFDSSTPPIDGGTKAAIDADRIDANAEEFGFGDQRVAGVPTLPSGVDAEILPERPHILDGETREAGEGDGGNEQCDPEITRNFPGQVVSSSEQATELDEGVFRAADSRSKPPSRGAEERGRDTDLDLQPLARGGDDDRSDSSDCGIAVVNDPVPNAEEPAADQRPGHPSRETEQASGDQVMTDYQRLYTKYLNRLRHRRQLDQAKIDRQIAVAALKDKLSKETIRRILAESPKLSDLKLKHSEEEYSRVADEYIRQTLVAAQRQRDAEPEI
jgi:hypothetical protein